MLANYEKASKKQLIDNPRWKKCRGSLLYVLVKTHAKGLGVESTTFHPERYISFGVTFYLYKTTHTICVVY